MFILRYIKNLISHWITIAFFVVDIGTFVIASIIPNLSIPREVYWWIAILGFIAANIRLYVQLENKLSFYEEQDGFMILNIVKAGLTPNERGNIDDVEDTSWNELFYKEGLPRKTFLFIELETNNLAQETGEFQFNIDDKKSSIEPLFKFIKDIDHTSSRTRLQKIQGNSTIRLLLRIPIKINEQEPIKYAMYLSNLRSALNGKVFIRFSAKYNNRQSKRRIIEIPFDYNVYILTVMRYWKHNDYDNLADIAMKGLKPLYF